MLFTEVEPRPCGLSWHALAFREPSREATDVAHSRRPVVELLDAHVDVSLVGRRSFLVYVPVHVDPSCRDPSQRHVRQHQRRISRCRERRLRPVDHERVERVERVDVVVALYYQLDKGLQVNELRRYHEAASHGVPHNTRNAPAVESVQDVLRLAVVAVAALRAGEDGRGYGEDSSAGGADPPVVGAESRHRRQTTVPSARRSTPGRAPHS